ncbi:MAG: hypothetical protein V7609_2105 [Verrucomicrobiota bacterium]
MNAIAQTLPFPRRRSPVAVVRDGNVSIPIYLQGDGRYCIIYRELGETDRTHRPYKDLAKAKTVAKSTAVRLAAGEQPVTREQRAQLLLAETILEPFGVSLVAALEEWAAAKRNQSNAGPAYI